MSILAKAAPTVKTNVNGKAVLEVKDVVGVSPAKITIPVCNLTDPEGE